MKAIKCPAGTYGLAVAPWSADEIYAVAADWRQAAAPVMAYGPDGWYYTGRQVADYRHSPRAALAAELAEAISASNGDDDPDSLCQRAVKISD
jgi:hypothetical protein